MRRLSSKYVLQKCNARDICLEDRISQLPDEIIVVILSLLTLTEAMTTSILSRRWRYIWTFSTGSLNFDAERAVREVLNHTKSCKIETTKYVGWVNHVLKVQKGNEIDQFKICFPLDENYSSELDSWVDFAMEKKVRRLELDLSYWYGYFTASPYTFPKIEELPSFSRSNVAPFSLLTSLCLIYINVTEEVLDYVLANCSFLEQLCVVGSCNLANLKVVGPSLKLKCLELVDCKPLENLEISAASLVSFTYSGPTKKVPFKNVPLLSELSISDQYYEFFIYESRRHLSYLSQLEKLVITIPFEIMTPIYYAFPLRFCKLHNLKQLELQIRVTRGTPLFCYTSLIEASPFLHRFSLKLLCLKPPIEHLVSWREERKEHQRATKHYHQCLKVIEIRGFYGYETDFELALHLLDIAVSLEQITVDTRVRTIHRFGYARDLITGQNIEAKDRALELRPRLPPGAELVII